MAVGDRACDREVVLAAVVWGIQIDCEIEIIHGSLPLSGHGSRYGLNQLRCSQANSARTPWSRSENATVKGPPGRACDLRA